MRRADGTHRIVVTGAGWCTPLGDRIDPVWRALLEGRSAVGRVRHYDASTFATDFAAETPAPSLAGRSAAAQVPVGAGDVVLFAFTPHFRGQPRNTFKMLFNALMGASTEGGVAGGLTCR